MAFNVLTSIDQMLEQSQTADIPVCNIAKDLHTEISHMEVYVSDIRLSNLLDMIQSQFSYLISLAAEHYMLRKYIRPYNNVPQYGDTTCCDIVENNYEFRDTYARIQVNISKFEILNHYLQNI